MTRRLDAAAAIALVGEDKILKELDKKTWYLMQPMDLPIYSDTRLERIITSANPLEYLVFNDYSFFYNFIINNLNYIDFFTEEEEKKIAKTLGLSKELKYEGNLYDTLINGPLSDDTEFEISNVTPYKVANAIWDIIITKSKDVIIEWFYPNYENRPYYLFDGNFNQILPIVNEKITETFFEEWFGK